MHLGSINLPDLLLGLWCGTIACDTGSGDDKGRWDWAVFRDSALWNKHGKQVAAATPYLPGSFDRPPRNPAEKLHSGYKAMEFLTYIYGLGPGLFYGVLPMAHWKSFCKLVRGVRIVSQKVIKKHELTEADRLLLEFCIEFEKLYYQRDPSRIHFVRQSIHALSHIATETTRIGPYAGVTQWTMENTIGNLGREVRQHSNAFANLAQRAVRRCQINAIKAMLPELDPPKPLPRNAVVLSEDYVLLHKHEHTPKPVSPIETTVFRDFVNSRGIDKSDDWHARPTVSRSARLRLPNGQVARSLWIEAGRPLTGLRMSRNVKIRQDGITKFAEVRYYFRMRDHADGEERTYAMVDMYGDPDADLLEQSSHTLWSCAAQQNGIGLQIVDVTDIKAVVAMVPHPPLDNPNLGDLSSRVFVVEKVGLDVLMMGGVVEETEDETEE
ncbi:hypothetical protein BC629DRAFT_1280765 [Irpex lacteus]|nr:hypothetical protein BC629DRAFT_1280366 [Irpex lacteus]KAI0812772.1 hypothetical protein BC629DRAFT_1280765 [Irpex lacteus]